MQHTKLLNLFLSFLLINSSLLIIYSLFFPNATFLFFQQTYLEVLAIADTGGNGSLNLLTYPLSLYLMCTFGCIQYLRTQEIFYLNFLTILWTLVLISRIISLLAIREVTIDLYFFFGIHKNARLLIKDAKENIENWLLFIDNIENLSNEDASIKLVNWLTNNYKSLGIDNKTIENYIENGNFAMQVEGIRNYLSKKS